MGARLNHPRSAPLSKRAAGNATSVNEPNKSNAAYAAHSSPRFPQTSSQHTRRPSGRLVGIIAETNRQIIELERCDYGLATSFEQQGRTPGYTSPNQDSVKYSAPGRSASSGTTPNVTPAPSLAATTPDTSPITIASGRNTTPWWHVTYATGVSTTP